MSLADFHALLPLLCLAGGALAVMLIASARRGAGGVDPTVARREEALLDMGASSSAPRHPAGVHMVTSLSLLAAAVFAAHLAAGEATQLTPLLRSDAYGQFFAALFCLAGLTTCTLARPYLAAREMSREEGPAFAPARPRAARVGQSEEFHLLLLLAVMGAVTLACASHLAALLLGMELLGVSLYALIAYPERGAAPLEAAIKYLVLSGAASATLLFGFALLYAALGALDYAAMGQRLQAAASGDSALLLAGGAMIFAGAGFKLSVVPFHMWTPDVYEGAPAPVAGFLAAVSKVAVFVALLRWFIDSGLYQFDSVRNGLALLAGASILAGNLLALRQENIKRLLAYSSIAHMGYLLVFLVAAGRAFSPALAVEAGCFYAVAYLVTTLAAFSLLAIVGVRAADERDEGGDIAGLFWRSPALAVLLGAALLSLAGIPLTAGFIGKLYVFSAGIEAGLWTLTGLVALGSAIGIYYYLRLIFAMSQAAPAAAFPVSAAGVRALIAALVAAVLYLGVLPQSLMEFLRAIL